MQSAPFVRAGRFLLMSSRLERQVRGMTKVADIKVGEVYWTEVSGRTVKVKVISGPKAAYMRKRADRFVVQRVDNGKILEKMRTAHALVPAFDVVPATPVSPLIGGRLEGADTGVCEGLPEAGGEEGES